MDINTEALNGLTTVIQSLLPDVVPPELPPFLLVTPMNITPTGLGGFVGLNNDPQGDILGRRLEATVHVTARAAGLEELNNAVPTITQALLGLDRATLLENGVLQISLDEIAPVSSSGQPGELVRELKFRVLYEFLKIPEESEELIEQIPINVGVG